MQCVVRPAFEMAVDDDMIRKNPFKFKLSDVIPKDAFVRTALTREQQDLYLQFFQEYGGGSYYDDIVILLGTGLPGSANCTASPRRIWILPAAVSM